MSPAPILRAADPADAPALALLHDRAFPYEAWEPSSLIRLLGLPCIHARLADSGLRAPAGFILALIVGGEAEVLTLCVDPAQRRRGLARALLADLYEQARRGRAIRAVLEVAADNEVALALYRGEGFAPVGRRPGYYRRPDTAPADAVILARQL
ncbi:MAG TPA: GNAT family N-acetyltransferase [Stellaceae bacterium]|nr:GNAT family N-acetyltransferase [Stellaceae bacterium]